MFYDPQPPPPRFRSRRTLAPQRAPGLYASTYEPQLGAAICRRLAAGDSLRSICRADPSMPTEKTVWNWARAHEEFRLMKTNALAVARARSLAEQRARDTARRAGLKQVHPDGYSPELGAEIMTRVMMGEGLQAVCRDPAMPCVGTVYNWMRRYPELLDDYRRAKAWVEEIMVEAALADLPPLGDRKAWPILRRRVRATETAARRLSLKRYAPATGPRVLTVRLEAADGTARVIYRGELPDAGAAST